MNVNEITALVREAENAMTRVKVADETYDRAMRERREALAVENAASMAADKAILAATNSGDLSPTDLWRLHRDMGSSMAFVMVNGVMSEMYDDYISFSGDHKSEALSFWTVRLPTNDDGFLSDETMGLFENRLSETIRFVGVRPDADGAYFVRLIDRLNKYAGVISWVPGGVSTFTAEGHDAITAPTLSGVLSIAHAHCMGAVSA